MLQMNLLIGKTVANKNSDIFLRIIHNICKIKLAPSYFSYIHICLYFLSNVELCNILPFIKKISTTK